MCRALCDRVLRGHIGTLLLAWLGLTAFVVFVIGPEQAVLVGVLSGVPLLVSGWLTHGRQRRQLLQLFREGELVWATVGPPAASEYQRRTVAASYVSLAFMLDGLLRRADAGVLRRQVPAQGTYVVLLVSRGSKAAVAYPERATPIRVRVR
ncbi:MAG: hypothetical protein IPK74_31760 [Deltaproteobacteria bacterium]|nr:hypothetical protein [Deltaproteobacteria bacterium]